jgi:hypothetical protein
MNGDKVASAEAARDAPNSDGRQRSTIGFPYMPLKDAVELVEAIHGNVGLGDCGDDQLAAWTNQSIKSSGFRVQIASARLFGLITGDGTGRIRLTDLGRQIVDPAQAREAKATAFQNVPLYKAIYDMHRGGVLPSQAAALEREMVGLGVSEKVKDRARQTFERSAEQAGYFEHGRNRLVMPAVTTAREPEREELVTKEVDRGGNGGGGGENPPDIDPIIRGLLSRLPKTGEVWPEPERKLWLQLLEGSFQLIYKTSAPEKG